MACKQQITEIDETLEEFYQDCRINGFCKSSIENYRSCLKIWQRFLAERGICELSDLTRGNLREYNGYLQMSYRSKNGKPLATTTIARRLTVLRSFLSFCVRVEKLLINPEQALPTPRLPRSLPKGVLSKQQVKKLLRLPNTRTLLGFRNRAILELFYATGIRRNELITIKVAHCHLSERRIFIKEGKYGTQRWVPVGKKVTEILRRYLQEIRPGLLNGKGHDFLFVGYRGGKLSGKGVYAVVKHYMNELNIDSACHGLRHTCATHLLKGKANVRVIQSLLGHRSLCSTQIYTHVDISEMARAIQKAHPRERMSFQE